MGFFDRLAFGWRLGTTSLGVVARDKTLMLFPVLSGIACVLLVGAFVMGIGPEELAQYVGPRPREEGFDPSQIPPMGYVLAFSAYFALAFIAVYFNVALLGAAQLSIAGKDTTLGDGLRVANAHLGKVIGWALLTGTVGLLLSALESNKNFGRIVRKILGTAWSVITYFVVPVMIFENQAPTAAIGRSIDIMQKSWGENAGAQVGIGLVVTLLVVLLVGVGVGAALLVPMAVLVVLPIVAIGVPAVIVLGMAAKAVLSVGLYEFATGTGSKGVFNPEELKAAFR